MVVLNILLLLLLLGSITTIVAVASEFYTVYSLHALRQREGLWLYEQCKQPEFLVKLSQHSDACFQINDLFERPPLHKAWAEVVQKLSFAPPDDFQLVFACLLLAVAILGIMIPPYLSCMERRERHRLTLAVFAQEDDTRPRLYSSVIRRPAAKRFLPNTGSV